MARVVEVTPVTILYRRKVRARTLEQMWKVMEQAGEFTVQSVIDPTSQANIFSSVDNMRHGLIKMVEVNTRDYSSESMMVLDVDFVIKTDSRSLRNNSEDFLDVTRMVYEVLTDNFLTSTVTNGSLNYTDMDHGEIYRKVTFNLECRKITAKIVKKLDNTEFLEFGTGIYEDPNGNNVFARTEGWGRVPFIKKEYAEFIDELCKPFLEKKLAPESLYGVLEKMVEKYPESKPEDLAYVVEWWRVTNKNKLKSESDPFSKLWEVGNKNNWKIHSTSTGRMVGKSAGMIKKGTDLNDLLNKKD